MPIELAWRFFSVLLTCLALVLVAGCSRETRPTNEQSLAALAEKVREHQEATKIGGDVVVRLGLRKRPEEIPAYGKAVSHEATKETRVIIVTEANDIVVTFGTGSVAYWTLTDTSGKLRKAVRAEPGRPESDVAVSEVQPRFEEEIAFWKTYLGIAE
jgi:hypothetical protein